MSFETVDDAVSRIESLKGGKSLRVSGLLEGERFQFQDQYIYPTGVWFREEVLLPSELLVHECFERWADRNWWLYVGVDLNGVQYIIPVQAKGEDENVGAVQAIQDIYCCREKFPDLVCRAIAAKTVDVEEAPDGSEIQTIAMVELAIANKYDVWIPRQERYQLVPASMISADELETYRKTAASRIPSLKRTR